MLEKEFLKFCNLSLEKRIKYIISILKKKNISFVKTNKFIYIPSKAQKVLLDCHIDIVGSLKKLEFKSGIFFGSGVSDNLGNSFALLHLIKKEKINLKKYSIVFPFDEEEEGKAPYLLNPKEKYIIVFEPTNLEIWNKNLGAYEFEMEIYGESTHGAYIPKKDSLKIAFNILRKFENFSKYLKKLDKYAHFNIVSFLGGHKSLYNHPLKTYLRFEIITSWKIKKDRFFSLLYKFKLEKYKKFLKEYDEGFIITLKKFPINFENMKKGICRSWTNAHAYYNLKKIPIVFGLGDLRYAHTKNEKLSLKELKYGIKKFEKLFNK